jgi:predicted phage replisome organizer
MSEVKWIKIVTDIFDDEKILLIESMPESDAVIVIWFKLLCLAGKNNNKGVFTLNERIAYTDEMIATIFRRPLNVVRMALKIFEQYGMIEIINGVITIPNWGKHQTLDQIENRRNYQREYMQGKRAEQKLLAECKPNSKPNVSPIEKEVEEDKNKKKNIYSDFTSNTDLLQTLNDFEKMRNSLKNGKMTDKARQMMLTELSKLANADETKIKILEQSIFNNWKGVFPLKEPSKAISNQKKTFDNFNGRKYETDYGDQFVEKPIPIQDDDIKKALEEMRAATSL